MVVARLTVKEADEASNIESDSADTDSEAEGDRGEPAMTEMQQACLSFCSEFLNQTIHNREYDKALTLTTVRSSYERPIACVSLHNLATPYEGHLPFDQTHELRDPSFPASAELSTRHCPQGKGRSKNKAFSRPREKKPFPTEHTDSIAMRARYSTHYLQ
jgi:hypothetical protein